MIGPVLAAALAIAPQSTLSGSADPQTEADFRCYAASLVLAGVSAEDQEMVNAASMVAFYYLGRLEGRTPETDWIRQGIEAGNSQPDVLIGELPRCGGEFEAKSRELIDKSGDPSAS